MIEPDDLALTMINAERERYGLDPLLPSALIGPEYDKVKRYARTDLEALNRS